MALGGGEVRLHRLLRSELESAALAIVASLLKRIEAQVCVIKGVKVVRLRGTGLDVTILASDWERLIPSLEADYFNHSVYPTFSGYGYLSLEELTVEGAPYAQLYQRVYWKLVELFPEDYSNLKEM